MMARCVVASAGLSVSFVRVVADGLFNDFVNSVNKLAAKASIVVSAFSSVGNLLAFVFCDLPDGKIDGRLTVVWCNNIKRRKIWLFALKINLFCI